MTTTTCDGDIKIRREEKDAVVDLLKSYNIKDRDVYYVSHPTAKAGGLQFGLTEVVSA